MELGLLTHLAAGVEIRVRHELEPYQQRLIAALGARYVIDSEAPVCASPCERVECAVGSNTVSNAEMDRRIAAMTGKEEVAVTRCAFCPWKFEGSVELGRDAYANHRRASHGGHEGRTLLEQMDRGEPLPKEEPMPVANGRTTWTRESSLAAVKAFAETHGHPPTVSDTQRKAGVERELPSYDVAKRLFGSWPDLIETAGFERPVRGRRQRAGSLSEREPRQEESSATRRSTGNRAVSTTVVSESPSRSESELLPAAPVLPSAPIAADPEKVDVFDLFRNLATEERIAFYEEAALQAQIKANALRQIREALEVLDA